MASVTGKRGIWREKPPDAESARLTRVPDGVGVAALKVQAALARVQCALCWHAFDLKTHLLLSTLNIAKYFSLFRWAMFI